MLRLMNVSILFNLRLIVLYLFGEIRVLFINFVKFIKFNFKCALYFFLINVSISERFLQIRTCIWLRIGLICMDSIQSIRRLNFSWNDVAFFMSWARCFSAWLSRIRLEIIESLLLSRLLIVNTSFFISSNLFNIWLMLSESILILIYWAPAINNLVAAIINNFGITGLSVSTRSSMCSLSYLLLDKMPRWLFWLLPLKVIDNFFF